MISVKDTGYNLFTESQRTVRGSRTMKELKNLGYYTQNLIMYCYVKWNGILYFEIV
jgi:hypothetical protein